MNEDLELHASPYWATSMGMKLFCATEKLRKNKMLRFKTRRDSRERPVKKEKLPVGFLLNGAFMSALEL